MSPPDVLETVGLLFRTINVSFRQEIDDQLAEADVELSFGEVWPLSILKRQPGCNGAQLARFSLVSAQAMNSVLRHLAEKKYVERRDHPENQRADSWYLTEKGARLLERSRAVFEEVTSRMLSGLNTQEVKNLEKYLRSCAVSLGSTEETELGLARPTQARARQARHARKAKNS